MSLSLEEESSSFPILGMFTAKLFPLSSLAWFVHGSYSMVLLGLRAFPIYYSQKPVVYKTDVGICEVTQTRISFYPFPIAFKHC